MTPEIAAKAKELTREAKDDREKVLALYNYVTRLRYVAVPLGVNSFRPHAAANVLQNEYGDCKDKANLFNTLLRSVGIEAHLVLVPRFSQAHEDLPGLSFNHAISQVNLGGETVWVDTTDDVCRFGMLPPGDPGRKVLVIDGRTQCADATAASRAERARAQGAWRSGLCRPAGRVAGEAGRYGVGVSRLRVAHRRRGKRKNTPRRCLCWPRSFALPRALLPWKPRSATSVAALNEDFAWHATGTCVGLCSTAGGSRLLRAPFWLPKEWDLALHRRKAGLYLNQGYPLTLEEEFEFALPPKRNRRSCPVLLRYTARRCVGG